MTYKIIRFYAPHTGKRKRTIESGLTLEEAQEHCNRENTRGDGWFDGYQKEC